MRKHWKTEEHTAIGKQEKTLRNREKHRKTKENEGKHWKTLENRVKYRNRGKTYRKTGENKGK